MVNIPNIGWLFQKDYYQHEQRNGHRIFFTQQFDDKMKDKEEEKRALGEQYKRAQQKDQRARIREQEKKIQEAIDTLKKDKAGFFLKKNKTITQTQWDQYRPTAALLACESANTDPLALAVGYPGFITGTGLQRGIKDLVGEIKIGFAFDHVTGLPYLPGSSLKGLLRSAFPQHYNSDLQQDHPDFAANRVDFLKTYFVENQINITNRAQAWLQALGMTAPALTDSIAIDLLERAIFHSDIPQGFGADHLPVYQPLPIAQRDIFFDAYLEGDTDGAFLATDFLTPHLERQPGKEHLSPFTEPVPIEFLKVRPGMRFRFQWRLHDGLLTKAEKQALFTFILTTLGIGAKTNVGYGQLTATNA